MQFLRKRIKRFINNVNAQGTMTDEDEKNQLQQIDYLCDSGDLKTTTVIL